MRFLCFLLLLMIPTGAYAEQIQEIEGYLGIVTGSYAEVASNLTGPNAADPASGSFSIIASSFAYHFYKYKKYSVYIGGTVPMLSTQGIGYLNGFVGGEWHFNDVAHLVHANSAILDIYIQPKLRYHANAELALNFLTYSTESAKKSDTSFGLGVGGGASYSFSKNWAGKAKLIVSKDIGLITDSLAIKFFLGGIFFLDI